MPTLPQQLSEEMGGHQMPCRGPHHEVPFGVGGGAFLLQTVLVSMPETGSVGGPCDQVQEAR